MDLFHPGHPVFFTPSLMPPPLYVIQLVFTNKNIVVEFWWYKNLTLSWRKCHYFI